jgi:putative ABC transport system substrate-binding protein
MTARRVGAFVLLDDNMMITHAEEIANLALQQRLPSSGFTEFAIAGGLIGYGVNVPDMFRRAAAYVDKILKGARPSDLPVEQPTRFETILNLKTAKAIGFDVPTALLLRADEVIE